VQAPAPKKGGDDGDESEEEDPLGDQEWAKTNEADFSAGVDDLFADLLSMKDDFDNNTPDELKNAKMSKLGEDTAEAEAAEESERLKKEEEAKKQEEEVERRRVKVRGGEGYQSPVPSRVTQGALYIQPTELWGCDIAAAGTSRRIKRPT
jgi:hypothetical protein